MPQGGAIGARGQGRAGRRRDAGEEGFVINLRRHEGERERAGPDWQGGLIKDDRRCLRISAIGLLTRAKWEPNYPPLALAPGE